MLFHTGLIITALCLFRYSRQPSDMIRGVHEVAGDTQHGHIHIVQRPIRPPSYHTVGHNLRLTSFTPQHLPTDRNVFSLSNHTQSDMPGNISLSNQLHLAPYYLPPYDVIQSTNHGSPNTLNPLPPCNQRWTRASAEAPNDCSGLSAGTRQV